MKIDATSFEDYFVKSGEYETDLRTVDKLIRENAPHLLPQLFDSMSGGTGLAYGMIPYKTKAMKAPSEWPLLALERQKNYMAIYACAIIEGEYIGEHYGKRLGKASIGKSCIRFNKLSDLDQNNLIEMIRDIDTRYQRGERLYGDI